MKQGVVEATLAMAEIMFDDEIPISVLVLYPLIFKVLKLSFIYGPTTFSGLRDGLHRLFIDRQGSDEIMAVRDSAAMDDFNESQFTMSASLQLRSGTSRSHLK